MRLFPSSGRLCGRHSITVANTWHDAAMQDASEPEFLVEREVAHTVVLVDPDPLWAEQYAAEEPLIRAALGSVLVEVHHAGSTSVPDLPAKPIVDIVLVVEDPTDEASYVAP